MMSCGGSLTSCARGAGGSVAFLARKQRSNAPKTKTLVTRTRVDGVDFGGSGRAGTALGSSKPRCFLVARIVGATKQAALAVRCATRLQVAKVCSDR
jgi:hypothetical protein